MTPSSAESGRSFAAGSSSGTFQGREGAALGGEMQRVVVVNDDATQLNVLCGLLRKAELEALPFKSVEAALAVMSQDLQTDLVITDIYMPGIDGWRFCRLLRSPEYARFNQTPILVVSATFSGDEPSRITSDLGANAFLTMPVDGQQFIEQVQALLKGQKPLACIRVLIVEDSEMISRRLLHVFQAHGYQAEAAFTCQEGLRMFGQAAYDILVLDYHLPDGLGDSLLENAQARFPDCVCIMMTGDPQPELALTWMKMGAAAYVHKPFEPEYLIALCERARRERALLRSQDLLKQRTRQLWESEVRFRSAMSATSDGLWDWDVPSGQVYFSPAYLGMLGYSSNEFPATLETWLDLMHPDDREFTLAANQACLQNESDKIDVEFRMRARDGSWRWVRGRGRAVQRDEAGQALQIIGTHVDITERKQLEEALERRLVALTRPLDQPAGIEFNDLFDLESIQRLQDEFSAATGVASIITGLDGRPITRPSNFCRLCSEIIRKTEKGRINCFKSDAEIGRFHPEGPVIQPCMSGGLWDAGAGISVGGRQIANWLIGQVRDETQAPSVEKIREYAHEIGADEVAVIEAFREVPSMSQAQFQRVAQALFTMTNQLSAIAYQNIQQARFITERQQAETALRESETRFRAIFENVPLGMFQSTPEGKFVYANPALASMLCYETPGELVQTVNQTSIAEALYEVPTRRPWVVQQAERKEHPSLRSLENWSIFENRYKCKDGHIIDAILSFGRRADPITGQIFLYGFVQDVTVRKQMEQALRESEEKYRLIVENQQDLLVKTDIEGRLLYVNSVYCEYFEKTEAELLGKHFAPLVHPDDLAIVDQALTSLFNPPFECAYESRANTRQGWRWLSWVAKAVQDEHGVVVALTGAGRDISERKQAEKKIIEQLDELRRWQNVILGREDRILDLKREVNKLLVESGKPERYVSAAEAE